ncbi:MAG: asparagine synthase (glutamine-hydrolyzing) [bacterium]|nr:asparagine synthase (glutamine-hydrolyzing) [bacterium]
MGRISGGIWFAENTDRELITRMSKLMTTGKDNSNEEYFDPKCGLSINLPAKHKGTPTYPLHNENKSIWLIIDGEIYNAADLKSELITKKHIFYANMDNETILHLYEEKGPECLKKLNGSFALAIYDSNNNTLLLARDRLGIKPLYYWENGKQTLFASEIKALLLSKDVKKTPNDAIIYDFLATGVHEHTEDTFFAGIKKVMQGEYILINNREIKKTKYWELGRNVGQGFSLEKKDKKVLDEFISLFEDSVRIRTEWGRGKTGALLSGGLDSSFVTGVLNEFIKPVTFSSCHPDFSLDELKYVKAVTRKHNLYNSPISSTSKDIWGNMEECIWHEDEPIRALSSVDHFLLMKFVDSQGIDSLFDGQGGDELFHGYLGHYMQFLNELLKQGHLLRFTKEFLSGIDLIGYGIKDRWLGRQDAVAFIHPDFKNKFNGREKQILNECFPNTLKEKSFFAITKYSIPFLLKETERNAGAFGIELKLPFLDHRIVEYVFSLPVKYKIRNSWSKWLLRKSGSDLLPEPVKKRRRKIGFGTPEARWTYELRQKVAPILNEMSSKYMDKKKLLTLFNDFSNGKPVQTDFFWRIISLEIWLRKFAIKD